MTNVKISKLGQKVLKNKVLREAIAKTILKGECKIILNNKEVTLKRMRGNIGTQIIIVEE